MDYAYIFEKIINKYTGNPDYLTYSIYWDDKNKRTALLFTACVKEYDKNSTGEVGRKLEYFMDELFNDNDDKSITIDCLNYLTQLKP